jgi:hypothetical protein
VGKKAQPSAIATALEVKDSDKIRQPPPVTPEPVPSPWGQ